MTNSEAFVFIESNTTGTGELYLERALTKGYAVYFLTNQPLRYPFLNKFDVALIFIDTSDIEKLITFCKNIKNLVAILSSSEFYIEIASQVARKFGLFSSDAQAVCDCRNKFTLFNKLSAGNIQVPKTILLKSSQEIHQDAEKLSFPIICKPHFGTGSIGVKLCKTQDEFIEHANNLLAAPIDSRERVKKNAVLAQEYIDGDEYSVEIIGTEKGFINLGITKKYLGPEPNFLEIGHDFPSVLATKLSKCIISEVYQALSAVKLIYGPTHVEVRVKNNQVFIIEINPRLAGGMIPALIEESYNIDLLGAIIDLYANKAIELVLNRKCYSSIRFLVPKNSGVIQVIDNVIDTKLKKHIRYFSINKKVGDAISIQGDYRDRIGYVIVTGESSKKSQNYSNQAISNVNIHVEVNNYQNNTHDTGRIKQPLTPEALKITSKEITDYHLHQETQNLIAIDEAHLLMLVNCKLMSCSIAKKILNALLRIKSDGMLLFERDKLSRGLYLYYEKSLSNLLGEDVVGNIHIGRSRNDINATLFKINLRQYFKQAYAALWQLRMAIIERAKNSLEINMPIYSQYQVALPGTYSYYLCAIESGMSRHQNMLKNIIDEINLSPLGAAAGGGTTFATQPEYSAKLLGFTTTFNNALDAVANRDSGLMLLNIISMSASLLSRVAQDYQLWTTQEFSFFDLPDDLVGSSSMLPQKRNPFLLEKVKGIAARVVGELANMLSITQKVAFANSVEISTESIKNFSDSITLFSDACTLLRLCISNAEPNALVMKKSIENGLAMATNIVDELVREQGFTFRKAHHFVGNIIHEAINSKTDPYAALLKLFPQKINSNPNCLSFAKQFKFGNGPGTIDMHTIDRMIENLNQDSTWMYSHEHEWRQAEDLRSKIICKILA